jgi:hypothetical protein
MNKNILLEINRVRTLMSLSEIQPYNLINEAMAKVLAGLERQIAGRWLSEIMSEYINKLINTSIKNARKAINPQNFVKNNLSKVVKEVETKLSRVLTQTERETLEASMQREMVSMVNTANKDVGRKLAKDAVKNAQKNIVDPLAKKQPGQVMSKAAEKAANNGASEAAQKVVNNAVEASTTQPVKTFGDKIIDKLRIRSLQPKAGWTAIKNHFKRNYGKYLLGGGVSALAVYFYYYGEEAPPPLDVEEYTDEETITGGGTGTSEEGVYTTSGDPYQYKVMDCVWYTKGGRGGKIISDWKSLANNADAMATLDQRHPEARKECSQTPAPVPEPAPEVSDIEGEEEIFDPNSDF